MKKTLLVTFLSTVTCCIMIQCTQNATDDVLIREMNDRELMAYLGYNTEGIIEREKFYLLQPDLIVSKQWLEEMRNKPLTRMQKNPVYGLLSEENQTVYVMDKNTDRLKDALRRAVEEWNSIESNLRFVIDNNHYNAVDIYAGDYGFGAGTYLINIENPNRAGEYGKYAHINFNQYPAWATDYYQSRDVMMHVLGHLAGFGHAITDPLITTPPTGHIYGTIIYDPESIMRSEQDVLEGYPWDGFSDWDREAIKKAYPVLEKPAFTLSCTPEAAGPYATELALGSTYRFTATYTHSSCPNPKYEITIKKTGHSTVTHPYETTGNGIFTVKFTETGNYKISVKVTNATKSNLIEKTFTVSDPTVTEISCTPEGEGTDKNKIITYRNYTLRASYSHPACPEPQYEISIDKKSGYELENTDNGEINVRFLKIGTYKISVSVSNAPIPTLFEKSYIVTDPTETSIDLSPAAEGADKNELTTNEMYTIHASYSHPVCPNPEYSFSIENGDDYQMTTISGKTLIRFIRSGVYKLVVQVTNAPVPTRFEKTYYVYDPAITEIICSPDGLGEEKNNLLLNVDYTFSAKYIHEKCPFPIYSVKVDKFNGYVKEDMGNGIVSIRFTAPGTYKIIATVTNLTIPVQFEKKVIVPDQDAHVRISGPTIVNTWDDFDFQISYRNPLYPDPEFEITVTETTFNDPQFLLQRKNNNDFSVFFGETGYYIIEARVKDAPEIKSGKYFVPAFDQLTCTLQEPVIVNTINYLNEYATEALFTNIINDGYLQTRVAFYVHIKKEYYVLTDTGSRKKINLKLHTEETEEVKLLTMRVDFIGSAQLTLPVLKEEILTIDPFVGKIISVPSYEKVTFPDLVCREYDPTIDD